MNSSGRPIRKLLAALLLIACAAALITPSALKWYWPELPAHASNLAPSPRIHPDGRVEISHSPAVFAAPLATFRDELFAYLMYQHYLSSGQYSRNQLLLHRITGQPDTPYQITLIHSSDRIASTPSLPPYEIFLLPASTLERYRKQTQLFIAAHSLPVQRKIEDLSPAELASLMRRFIRFKSTTDPRVRRSIEPVPQVLQPREAHSLAGDIIAVADFFNIPLDFLLGIGAVENNYMNIRGDLNHSIWKSRPAPDDIIIQRRRGRYRVLNDSAGVWQITRETLRYAHRLYLRDTRDYSQLPEHLRPAPQIDINNVPHDLLTTYAGLLLRDLIDQFNGDLTLAAGAYNGGPGNPNLSYSAKVKEAAAHARQVLEQAAALNGQSVLQIPWWTSR